MAYVYAKLNSTNLPIQFSYTPASPKKRVLVQKTAGGIRIHVAPTIIAGDSIISWNVFSALRNEWDFFQNVYKSVNTTYTFTGYWGDVHTVLPLTMSDPKVRSGGLFTFDGVFQVTATTSWGSP